MKTTPLWLLLFRVPYSIWWTAKAALLFTMRRWYIWRTAPDWLLQHVNHTFDPEDKDIDSNARLVLQGAVDEWALRKRRRNLKRKS